MIILLLVRIICNDVFAVQSIIPPAKDFFRMQDNNTCKKETMVKRSNLDEQVSNERFDKNIDLEATFNPERKKTKSLAQKLAKEALESPQLQRNIKKLANLSGITVRNHSNMKGLLVDRMKSIREPIVSTRKLNELLNRNEKRTRKRNKYGLERFEEHPWLRKQNHIKVSKRKILLFEIFFYLNINLISNIYCLEETTKNKSTS